jgi:hypothetical protein
MIRLIDILCLGFTLLLGLWFFLPSSVFLKPQILTYHGREVTFVRETPFGGQVGDWLVEVSVVGSMMECVAFGRADYQLVEDAPGKNTVANMVRYKADPRLWPCLDQKGEKIARHTWVIHLFGVIPLRRASLLLEVGE